MYYSPWLCRACLMCLMYWCSVITAVDIKKVPRWGRQYSTASWRCLVLCSTTEKLTTSFWHWEIKLFKLLKPNFFFIFEAHCQSWHDLQSQPADVSHLSWKGSPCPLGLIEFIVGVPCRRHVQHFQTCWMFWLSKLPLALLLHSFTQDALGSVSCLHRLQVS